jgi:ABC-type antimicrobial peptide transport system permease subunit
LETFVSDSVQRPRFYVWAMGAFAAVAVLLSSVAVYGLLTLDVVQRRQEIGVRMALGATGTRVGTLVMRRAALLATGGVVIGVLTARALSRYMESLLVEVAVTDTSVFVGSAALAMVIASLAACAPAYRAVSVDPSTCLRGE